MGYYIDLLDTALDLHNQLSRSKKLLRISSTAPDIMTSKSHLFDRFVVLISLSSLPSLSLLNQLYYIISHILRSTGKEFYDSAMKDISKIGGLSSVLTGDSEFGSLYLAAKQGLSVASQNEVVMSLASSGVMNSSNASSLVMAITLASSGAMNSSNATRLVTASALASSGAMNSSNAASLVMASTGILTSSDSEKLKSQYLNTAANNRVGDTTVSLSDSEDSSSQIIDGVARNQMPKDVQVRALLHAPEQPQGNVVDYATQPTSIIKTSNNFERNSAKRVELGQVEKFSFSQIPGQQELVTGDGNVMYCQYGCSLQLGGSAIESCVYDSPIDGHGKSQDEFRTSSDERFQRFMEMPRNVLIQAYMASQDQLLCQQKETEHYSDKCITMEKYIETLVAPKSENEREWSLREHKLVLENKTLKCRIKHSYDKNLANVTENVRLRKEKLKHLQTNVKYSEKKRSIKATGVKDYELCPYSAKKRRKEG
jgi:hypothetical protein